MAGTACLVCGEDAFSPHLEILRKCRRCGFVTALPAIEMDYRALYDGGYFKGEEYLDYSADEAFFKKNFRRRLGDVLRHCPTGRLLELGAAYGFFMDLARSHFEVVGYEVNREAVASARERFGVDIRSDDFLDATVEDLGGPVDVTVMWDVIEHLERPDRFVERIGGLSRPGATLHITTGDIGSLLARARGRKWRMIHPPTHLHYFDRRTLPRLLAAHGFQTLEIRSVGVARSLRQVLYSILVLHLNQPGLYRKLSRPLPATLGFTLDTGDIMHVIARKQG
jgi:hypothetical protein